MAWTEGYRSEDYGDPDGGHALVRVARVGRDGKLLGRAGASRRPRTGS